MVWSCLPGRYQATTDRLALTRDIPSPGSMLCLQVGGDLYRGSDVGDSVWCLVSITLMSPSLLHLLYPLCQFFKYNEFSCPFPILHPSDDVSICGAGQCVLCCHLITGGETLAAPPGPHMHRAHREANLMTWTSLSPLITYRKLIYNGDREGGAITGTSEWCSEKGVQELLLPV